MDNTLLLGIGLHALGGIAASACFVPQKGTARWPYQNFWLLMCLASWLVVPIIVAFLTVPQLGDVIARTETAVMVKVTILGAIYGFGGMAFGIAIRHIGFSLTYAVAIGISAILGTIIPPLLDGKLAETFDKPGGNLIIIAGILALIGIAICGAAGKFKENELQGSDSTFNVKLGLGLVVLAGILSAVFGLSLDAGKSMDVLATENGAGQFAAGAKYIFAMGGAFITNLIWWSFVHFRKNTWKEYSKLEAPATETAKGSLGTHYFFALLAGVLWYAQFFFYGIGHTRMGNYGFISWGLHMAMLVFFSFIIGIILKEWKGLSKKTLGTLTLGLIILAGSFLLIMRGAYEGQKATPEKSEQAGH